MYVQPPFKRPRLANEEKAAQDPLSLLFSKYLGAKKYQNLPTLDIRKNPRMIEKKTINDNWIIREISVRINPDVLTAPIMKGIYGTSDEFLVLRIKDNRQSKIIPLLIAKSDVVEGGVNCSDLTATLRGEYVGGYRPDITEKVENYIRRLIEGKPCGEMLWGEETEKLLPSGISAFEIDNGNN